MLYKEYISKHLVLLAFSIIFVILKQEFCLLTHIISFIKMSYSQENKQEGDNFSLEKSKWSYLKEKKDSFFTNMKTKLSQRDNEREKVGYHPIQS